MVSNVKIFQLIKHLLLIILVYVSYLSYQGYNEYKQHPLTSFSFWKQTLTFLPIWSQNQFESKIRFRSLKFSLSEQQNAVIISILNSGQTNKFEVLYSDLEIQNEDAKYFTNVDLLSEKFQIIKLSSRFITIVYNLKTKGVCYSQIHLQEQIEQNLFVDSLGHLWVFSYPNFNIIISRVFNTTQRSELNRVRYPLKQKVQLIQSISEQKSKLIVKMLTYSRNMISLQFNSQTFDLHSKQDIKSHSFTYFTQDVSQFTAIISQKIIEGEIYQELMNLAHKASFGLFGHPFQIENDSRVNYQGKFRVRDEEADFQFQAFDSSHNLMIEINKFNNLSQIVSFGEVLLPMRTPVFISKRDSKQLMPFDQILNRSKNEQPLPSVDFKVYGIKSKNLQILKGKTGLYRLLPDSAVHFMTFNKNYLSFYPKENLKNDDYYTVRVGRGGITMMGPQIKGIFDETPVTDQNALELNFGFSKDEMYHEHTTNGAEVAPSIYEAHAAHKGLFAKSYRKRVDLITSMSGKSLLSHYISQKQGFQYSGSFIQNNEFWVFEHKKNEEPLITKYELFVNASSPKSFLSIKRTYRIPTPGRILSIQKCIDFFYYIDYRTEDNKYGIARVHHVLFSNRQQRPDGKYSGAFEKMMIIPNIERNTKFVVTSAEEQLIMLELQVDQQIVQDWTKLQLKHQYRILPMRVYSYKNQFYVFNVRKLMINAFDYKVYAIKVSFYEKLLLGSAGLTGLLIILIIYQNKSKSLELPQTKKDKDPKQMKQDKSKQKEKEKKTK